MDGFCQYSTEHKQGIREYKLCTLTNQMCPFMRICQTKNKVVHTLKANGCELKLKEERK